VTGAAAGAAAAVGGLTSSVRDAAPSGGVLDPQFSIARPGASAPASWGCGDICLCVTLHMQHVMLRGCVCWKGLVVALVCDIAMQHMML
jgi:hypothetical protein